VPFQPGNKLGGRSKREKLFETALMMELKAAGEDMPALRRIARNLIAMASEEERSGSTLPAIKEFADRIDGKVPQGIIGGGEEDGPIQVVARWLKTEELKKE
jgi:hypothetical protein